MRSFTRQSGPEIIALLPNRIEVNMPNSQIVLQGVSPTLAGLQWQGERVLRVGRTPNMEVMIDDRSVSRRHAEILLGPDGWGVADLGSCNGTHLNGVRIGRAFQKLRQYDLLQFGEPSVSVKTLCDATPAPTEKSTIRTTGSFVKLQAAARSPWQHAVKSLSDIGEQRPSRDKGFLALLRAGHFLCQVGTLGELLQSVLQETVSALGAQRGAILLMDDTAKELQLRASVVGSGCPPSFRSFSQTLADRCFQEGQSLLCVDPRIRGELATGSIRHGSMASIISALMRTPRKRLGVLHLDRGPIHEPFTEDDLCLADGIAASVSTGIECARFVEQQHGQSIQMVTALAQAVELRDQYTAGHTQRVTTYSMLLARELGFSREDQQIIQIGTPLHDLGKIGVCDSVLRKAGKLSSDEFEHVKLHTVKGAQILETMPDLANLIPILRSHHERWDGRGYPDGLAGGRISPLARVVAIADAFDAMTSDRPYRAALSVDRAFDELDSHAGKHFDPAFIQAFRRIRPHVESVLAQENSQQLELLALAETVTPQQLICLPR
jgi:HD-GYP domain-containing protein (c-di-GMP phosphodiesterase class II)